MATRSNDAVSPNDLARAIDFFHQQIDFAMIDQLQPSGPMAVYRTSIVVWLLIYQRLHNNVSLEAAVAELLNNTDLCWPNKRIREKTLSANTTAYSRARSRLGVGVAEQVADHTFATMFAAVPPSLGDRHVFLMDGTTVSLSSNNSLRRRWPPGSNQHGPGNWPICHLVCAHEMGSGMSVRPEIGAMYGPEADSELALSIRLLRRIPTRAVLMADRNFGVFSFTHAAAGAGHDVVTRLTEPRFQALRAKADVVGPGRWRVQWRPSRADRETTPSLPADAAVSVYLHEFVGFSGKTLWVLTTLDVETAEVAKLYARRWEIETDIRHLKRALQLDAMRGQSPEMVVKEIAMATVSYNLVIQVRRLAAERAKVPPKRISFTGVWSLVTIMLLAPNNRTAEEWEEKFEWALRGAGQRKLPNRPGRSYPREVIPRRRKHPERPRKTNSPPGL